MGTRTDVAEILGQTRWSEEGFYLGEIAKSSAGFPCLVKVTRGQYQSIGQPSFSNPSLFSYLLLVSAGKQLSVAAQCVKFKNQRSRVVPFGPTLAIPAGYEGHFEILSEDGRSVPCIQSVEALAKKFPDSCLVREPIKGFKPAAAAAPEITNQKKGHGDHDIEKIPLHPKRDLGSESVRISDKTRVIQTGEVLVLLGEVSVTCGKNKVTRYLGCFDSKGQTVYLSLSSKGKFSPLAREESISGVHTTKNILTKRMPLMVRLVDGKPPVMTPLTKSSSFKFLPELRLFSTLQEELIFAMPLSQSSKESPSILPLPLSVPLKFQVCRNMETIEPMKEFCRTLEKVKSLSALSKDLIQIYDINLKKELRFDGRQWKSYAPPIFLSSEALSSTVSLNPSPNSNSSNNEIPDMQDYEDIDEIYDYVRGIKPTPTPQKMNELHAGGGGKSIRVKEQQQNYSTIIIPAISSTRIKDPISIEDRPPEPPPIETIPTNRNRILVNNRKEVSRVNLNNQKNSSGGGVGSKLCRKPPVMTHQLNSAGNSPNNTTTSGSSGGMGNGNVSANLIRAGKHLYVKKQHSSGAVTSGGDPVTVTVGSASGVKVPGIISGSPSNRIVFRRSPIFDCRYKSMNDLNRSSLESGASGPSKIRHFQHNHHNNGLNVSVNSVTGSNLHQMLNPKGQGSGGGNKHRHGHGLLFRPKSFTSLLMPSFEESLGGRGSCRKLDMVVPSHYHGHGLGRNIHSPPPPPLELHVHSHRGHPQQQQRVSNRHRSSHPGPSLYL